MARNAWTPETAHGLCLSPFFEPLITPGFLPAWVSPALLILGSAIAVQSARKDNQPSKRV